MILVRRGQRVWSDVVQRQDKRGTMRSVRAWCWWLGSVLLIALTVSGCPKKPPTPCEIGPGGVGAGSSGIGEGTLPSPGQTTKNEVEFAPERGGPLQDIHFAYDSFALSSEARDIL